MPDEPSAESAESAGRDAERATLDAQPPFATWRAIYVIMLAALAAEIALAALLTASYR